MADLLAEYQGAVAALTDDELTVLLAVSQLSPVLASALLGWIEHAADWEQNRRKGFDFRLAPLDEAIDPSDVSLAIDAAIALHDEFAGDPRIARFFAAVVDSLFGRGQQR